MRPRLKFLQITKTRHGKTAIYFRRDRGPRIRLPDLEAKDFSVAYHAALAGRPIAHSPKILRIVDGRKQGFERYARKALPRIARKCKRMDRPFDITHGWLLAQAEAQKFCCALTGIPFYFRHSAESFQDPFGPSLDRINPKGGYTKDNVRLVVFALNVMLMDWGCDIFERVAIAYRSVQSGNIYSRTQWHDRPHLEKFKRKTGVSVG